MNKVIMWLGCLGVLLLFSLVDSVWTNERRVAYLSAAIFFTIMAALNMLHRKGGPNGR